MTVHYVFSIPMGCLALLLLLVRGYLWYLSLGKAALSLTSTVRHEHADSSPNVSTFYESSGDYDIWVEILIRNEYDRPAEISSGTLGVPTLQWSWLPKGAYWFVPTNSSEIDFRATDFPVVISPGEQQEVTVQGLEARLCLRIIASDIRR
ncbi:hypothetical protein [Salinibacter altiplanensis]|uniref:hypothetical protein n=1 Tax=Salinibacter altiplanensis TaxID=1803181 RepID=UPI000C9FCE90|nr:hypothetical protein [Salinibacter altiplanensis]